MHRAALALWATNRITSLLAESLETVDPTLSSDGRIARATEMVNEMDLDSKLEMLDSLD